MMDGWLETALGDGWLLKVSGALMVPVGVLAGWIMRRPMEKAGIRHQLDEAIRGHFLELRDDMARIRKERREDQEECDRELNELKAQVEGLQRGIVPAYLLKEKPTFDGDGK
jgi:hypothetical protein